MIPEINVHSFSRESVLTVASGNVANWDAGNTIPAKTVNWNDEKLKKISSTLAFTQ